MSPTRPKSIGVSPAPETTRGGRRCARITPLAPDTPNAGTPSAAQRRAQIDVELPGDDHLHDVERRIVGDAAAADDVAPRCPAASPAPSPAARRRARPAAAARRARARSPRPTSASASPSSTSPPSLMTASIGRRRAGWLRPRSGILQRRGLGQAQHQVHVLDRLAGAALDQVVGRADDRQRAVCPSTRRRAPSVKPTSA